MNYLVFRATLIAMALFSGCAAGEAGGQQLVPTSGVDTLMTQFNADKGRIRLVLLMSPT